MRPKWTDRRGCTWFNCLTTRLFLSRDRDNLDDRPIGKLSSTILFVSYFFHD